MTGFVEFSPLFSRTNVPISYRSGFSLVLTLFVYGAIPQTLPPEPTSIIQFTVIMMLELFVGLTMGLVMRIFFSVVGLGGEIIDTHMGFTMAQMYDPSSQTNMSVSAQLLNILFILVFFAENGHYTLIRLMLTSNAILPLGSANFGTDISEHVAMVFFLCISLGVKIALPIMAAGILGIVGMGILMKAIPQINAFVINLELKVILGFIMLISFLVPMNEYVLEVEILMLEHMENVLHILAR